MNKFLGLFVFSLLSKAASAQEDIHIPFDKCIWRGDTYGQMNQCEGNEILIGSCDSGRSADCNNGFFQQALCCDLPGYHWETCFDFHGDHGVHLSCPNLMGNDGSIMEGQCGSGMFEDCGGSIHTVKCCEGYFSDGRRIEAKRETCFWKYGLYGEEIQCDFDNQAIFGRCGSGRTDGCGDERWFGIECCEIWKI